MSVFQDKVVIVTGGASGIGRGISEAFAREGATVIIADLNRQAAQSVANAIAKSGGTAVATLMDVCDENSVTACIDAIHVTYNRIDILISNAGIQIVHPVQSFPFADWKAVLAVHLDGAFLSTKACLKYMYPANSGTIIYIGSVHSKVASPLKAAYVTAKHGLLGLARAVAKEGARHNVRTNVICPGFVRTPLVERQIPEQALALGITEEQVKKDVMLKDTVDGEFTSVEEVAEAVLFCAAARTNAITGQSLIVSHGWTME